MISIARYSSRNWSVSMDGTLLAVTVYKKGAMTVANTLSALTGKPITLP